MLPEVIRDLFGDIGLIFGTIDDVLRASSKILKVLGSKDDKFISSNYVENEMKVLSEALSSLKDQNPPKIALVGMTSAGKSSLINALFGDSVTIVKRTLDTTSHVFKINFPSGLVLYDTPGILGRKEEFENATRKFLGLPQDPRKQTVDSIPFKPDKNSAIVQLTSQESINSVAPIDLVLWVVDIYQSPVPALTEPLGKFFIELEKVFPGRIVVAGTHFDEFKETPEEERDLIIRDWSWTFGGQLIPVSSKKGSEKNLEILVNAIFAALPGNVSLSRLQDSLREVRQLDRLSFVIQEASNLIARIILLKGDQSKEIELATLLLFAKIYNHYSVGNDVWIKNRGDALKIANLACEKGIEENYVKRSPKGLIERFKSLFGKKFYKKVESYHKLGTKGLEDLIPNVYEAINEFQYDGVGAISKDAILRRLHRIENELEKSIEKDAVEELANKIGSLLSGMLINRK